jgi:carboxymethylenebutenolidase
MVTENIILEVNDGTTMAAYTARQDTAGSRNGILVFQEAFGVNAHIRDITGRFAREGYVAIAPELFHRTGPGFEAGYNEFERCRPHLAALTNDTMIADITASYDWLRSNTSGNIGSIGFCIGGRVSFLANTAVPLKAAVSFYGGGIAKLFNRLPAIHAPTMLIWGRLDKHISVDEMRGVADALKAADKEHVHVEFSDADHGFFCDARPAYNPHAAAQAWQLVLSFFETNLNNQQRATT